MSTDPTYRCEELSGGIFSISLQPELNEAPWTEIEAIGSEVVEQFTTRDRPRLIIDLSPLTYIGSAMVALIVRIWKAVGQRNGEIVVVNDNEMIGEVLEISGLADQWTIVPTREAAVQKLGGKRRISGGGTNRSRGIVWLGVAVVAVVIGVLGAADAIVGGFIADEIGRVPLLWGAAGLAGLGILCAMMAAWNSHGATQMVAVIAGTLAFVLLVGSILLIRNRAILVQEIPAKISVSSTNPAEAETGSPSIRYNVVRRSATQSQHVGHGPEFAESLLAPAGAADGSPRRQPWGWIPMNFESPGRGDSKIVPRFSSAPMGAYDLGGRTISPRLTPWAIIYRPYRG